MNPELNTEINKNNLYKFKENVIENFNAKYDTDNSYLKHIIVYLFILILICIIFYFMYYVKKCVIV